MGTDKEANGNYLTPRLTAEQQNARELECAKWQAEAALQNVAKAAERAAATAAKVARLELVFAQAKADREAFETAKVTRAQAPQADALPGWS